MKGLRRHGGRILALGVFTAVALGVAGGFRPDAMAWPTRLSPLLSLLGAVSARTWFGWTTALGVPLLLLALFKGRFFCWRVCPVGFLTELAGRLNPWGRRALTRIPVLNRAVLLVITVTAVCGYPLFLWLDPFCLFTGFLAAFRAPVTVASAVIGMPFAVVLVMAIAVPNVWCHRVCPLGGLQEVVFQFGKACRRLFSRNTETAVPPDQPRQAVTRRTVLVARPAAAAGLAAGRLLGPDGRTVLRPPGADLARINALCARCGNCLQACPYGLLHPALGEGGLDGLLTPVMKLRSRDADQEQYCFQDCVKCTEVCPTGAIRPLTVTAKHQTAIGVAVVDPHRCIAWKNNEYCAVCDEYCPFKAVKLVKHGDVMCPVVETAKCRGCGACESACPAEPIAIVVKPVRQTV